MDKKFDATLEARKLIEEDLIGYLMGVVAYPEDDEDVLLMMVEGVASRLLDKRLSGEYSLMEMNSVRNELTKFIGYLGAGNGSW